MREFTEEQLQYIVEEKQTGTSWSNLVKKFQSKFKINKSYNAIREVFRRESSKSSSNNVENTKIINKPKILIIDIETTPLTMSGWGLFDQNIALNQILEDWSILSWAAKWIGSDKVYYSDTRNEKNPRNDKKILKEIWELMDEADIIIGQNSISFDTKKLNARFILNGMKPPSSYRHIDTMRIAKRVFKFTSNKLEYLSSNLCEEHVKLVSRKFNGFELWKACLAKKQEAFKELEAYNIEDVLSTEELFNTLAPWDRSINFNVYHDDHNNICSCGSSSFKKKGFVYSNAGKYQRHICTKCGKEHVDKHNLLTKEKRASLRK
jgi:uncharacterized protein YprB with RNaseH-like and TPR domain